MEHCIILHTGTYYGALYSSNEILLILFFYFFGSIHVRRITAMFLFIFNIWHFLFINSFLWKESIPISNDLPKLSIYEIHKWKIQQSLYSFPCPFSSIGNIIAVFWSIFNWLVQRSVESFRFIICFRYWMLNEWI